MYETNLCEKIAEGKKGNVEIVHFEINEEQAKNFNFKCVISGDIFGQLKAGKYVKLLIDDEVVMSDTTMEKMTNANFIYNAYGDVLIAGLGLGLIINPLLEKEEVTSITIIEKNQNVIDLVGPYYNNPKINIINGDIFTWKPPKGKKWDTIYFDIWSDRCSDNIKEMKTLHRRFGKRVNRENGKRGYINSWYRDYF